MDGEHNGKPYFFDGWFGGTAIFGNVHIQGFIKSRVDASEFEIYIDLHRFILP